MTPYERGKRASAIVEFSITAFFIIWMAASLTDAWPVLASAAGWVTADMIIIARERRR